MKATRLPASAAPKKSKPSVKKPASRPKPTKPAKQEPKKELEEDFLHNIVFSLATVECRRCRHPRPSSLSHSSPRLTSLAPLLFVFFHVFEVEYIQYTRQ